MTIIETIREWRAEEERQMMEAHAAGKSRLFDIEAAQVNMLRAVENLLEKSSEWIDFRERRPEDQQQVLLWFVDFLNRERTIPARWDAQSETFYWDDYGHLSIPPNTPLFWLPLPESPTREQVERAKGGAE